MHTPQTTSEISLNNTRFNIGQGLTPTEEQEVALKFVGQFLQGKTVENRVMTLEGKAGTGKTSTLGAVLKEYKKAYPHKEVLGISVSNVAVQRLSEGFLKSGFSDVDTLTVAKALNLKPTYLPHGKIEFTQKSRKYVPIENYSVVVVDECSMVSQNLLELIIRHTEDRKARIIMLGDSHQLPPVENGPVESPTFRFSGPPRLVQRVRQKNSKFIPVVADKYDEAITLCKSGKSFKVFPVNRKTNYLDENGDGVRYVSDLNVILNDFCKYHKERNHPDAVRLITYTNNKWELSVAPLNAAVRKILYGHNPDHPVKGELVMLQDMYECPNSEEKLTNGTVMTINELVKEDFYDKVIDSSVEIWAASATTNYGSRVILRIPTKNGSLLLETWKKALQKRCNDGNMSWAKFYEWLEAYARVQYAYAITSHKAQGSTYERAYVMEHDIWSVGPIQVNPLIGLQSMYVACTRPTKNLIIYPFRKK